MGGRRKSGIGHYRGCRKKVVKSGMGTIVDAGKRSEKVVWELLWT